MPLKIFAGKTTPILAPPGAVSIDCDRPVGLGRKLEARDVRDRFLRFRGASHFLENAREVEVLAREIRLTRDRATLRGAGLGPAILPKMHFGEQIERLDFVDVEPAGVAERFPLSRSRAQIRPSASAALQFHEFSRRYFSTSGTAAAGPSFCAGVPTQKSRSPGCPGIRPASRLAQCLRQRPSRRAAERERLFRGRPTTTHTPLSRRFKARAPDPARSIWSPHRFYRGADGGRRPCRSEFLQQPHRAKRRDGSAHDQPRQTHEREQTGCLIRQ